MEKPILEGEKSIDEISFSVSESLDSMSGRTSTHSDIQSESGINFIHTNDFKGKETIPENFGTEPANWEAILTLTNRLYCQCSENFK